MSGPAVQPPIEISVQDLKRIRDEGAPGTLIDVREAWETRLCRIEGGIPMPLTNLSQLARKLDPAQPVYVYCHHGGRSLQAAMWLRRNGYPQAVSVRGGIEAWALEIDPAVPRY